jgi:hypothetical protein
LEQPKFLAQKSLELQSKQVHWLTIKYITLAERYGLKMGVETHSPIPAKLIFGEKETEDNPARCLVPKLV